MYVNSIFKIKKIKFIRNPNRDGKKMILDRWPRERLKNYNTLVPKENKFEEGDIVRLTIENHSDDTYWIIDEFHCYPLDD